MVHVAEQRKVKNWDFNMDVKEKIINKWFKIAWIGMK